MTLNALRHSSVNTWINSRKHLISGDANKAVMFLRYCWSCVFVGVGVGAGMGMCMGVSVVVYVCACVCVCVCVHTYIHTYTHTHTHTHTHTRKYRCLTEATTLVC